MPRKTAGTYTIAGRSFTSQYAYRKELARQRGYESVATYRTERKAERFLERLTPSRRNTYDRVLEAVGIARRNPDKPLSRIAREAGTTTKTITKYAGSAVDRSGRKWDVKQSDTLPRLMNVLTPEGTETVVIRDSKEATLLAKYSNALKRYLQTGDATEIEKFKGKTITVRGKRVDLITNRDEIDKLTRGGVIDEYEPYERSLAIGR